MTAEYRDGLVLAYPCIREIWLFGSRANNRARPDSDWDYLVFTDHASLMNQLCHDARFDDEGIDLFVVEEGLRVALNPWDRKGIARMLNLNPGDANLNWEKVSPIEAHYTETKDIPGSFNVDVRRARANLVYRR